ncbi:Catalase/peroxidase HPI [Phytophthora cinnamomi]|uniref:Catalase/peroxidase HPI n=1 Tax=Phytophthora cinnamomi TaxID=4785 RepID=UPI003559C9E8|nr:Catalase/peroxidase HPI [Phytophthora cinnamomi]
MRRYDVPATPRCFSPQKNWPVNAGVDKIITALEPVKESYPTLSSADRIELAGQVALDDAANNVTIDFMGGRTDANNGNGTEILAPRECRERSYKRSIVVTVGCVVLRGLVEGLSGRLLTPVTQSIAACCSVIEEEDTDLYGGWPSA